MERANSCLRGVSDCVANTLRVILFIFCSLTLLGSVFQLFGLLVFRGVLQNIELPEVRLSLASYVTPLILFGLALLGCHGAYSRSAKHLKQFALLISIFAVITIGVMSVSLALVDIHKLEHQISGRLTGLAKDYQVNLKPGEESNNATRTWDAVQTGLQCCGLENPRDWNKWNKDVTKDNFPRSCCLMLSRLNSAHDDGKCHYSEIYKIGCLKKIEATVEVSILASVVNAFLYLMMALVAIIVAKHAEPDASLLPFQHQKFNDAY